MSFSKLQVIYPPNFASLFSVMKDNSSVLFWSNNIYFARKEPIKVEILKISSTLIKIHQNFVIFETANQLF